jgi:hypothetical protein
VLLQRYSSGAGGGSDLGQSGLLCGVLRAWWPCVISRFYDWRRKSLLVWSNKAVGLVFLSHQETNLLDDFHL